MPFVVLYFYKTNVIKSETWDYLPCFQHSMVIDILDEHYHVVTTTYQPEQKRYKVWLEKR